MRDFVMGFTMKGYRVVIYKRGWGMYEINIHEKNRIWIKTIETLDWRKAKKSAEDTIRGWKKIE